MTPLPAPESIKALVFDLDGTLYQNESMGMQVHGSACRYVAGLLGVAEEEAAGILLRERRRLCDEGSGTLSHAVLSLGGDLKSLHIALAAGVHPEGVLGTDPRVIRMLKRLAGSYDLHLYTNNNRKLSGRIMQQIGVTGFFRKIYTIEDFWTPKPDRKTIEVILREIATSPEQTLFVGDRYEVDLRVPAALGCPVLETQTAEQLLELNRLVPEETPEAEETYV